MTWRWPPGNPGPIPYAAMLRAEVAELEDALDSKSSGALPRAGSIPAFGIPSLHRRVAAFFVDKDD